MNVPSWAVASAVAALVSLLTRWLGRDKALRWQAWFPFLVAVGLDVAAGAFSLPVLAIVQRAELHESGSWVGVTAGLIGPGLLRAKTPLTWKRFSSKRLFGPLRKIQEDAEDEIERVCTVAEASWLDTVLPRLQTLTLDQLADWTSQYLSRVQHKTFDPNRRKGKLGLVKATVLDTVSSEVVRRRTIVQILLDVGGHRAVRGLLQHAGEADPKPLMKRRWFGTTPDVERVFRALTIREGLRMEQAGNWIRICHADRRVDEELLRLAHRISSELRVLVRVEGVYEGWITVSPIGQKKEAQRCAKIVSWLVEAVTVAAAGADALVQRDGTVLDENTGRYASASLVVSATDAERRRYDHCSDAFCGKNLLLAVEVITNAGTEDGRTYKRKLCSAAGVPLYLLLDMGQGEAVLHSEPAAGIYQRQLAVPFGSQLTLPAPLGITLDTAGLAR